MNATTTRPRRTMTVSLALVACFFAALVLVVLSRSAADAHHGGTVSRLQSSTWTICVTGTSSGAALGLDHARDQLVPTNVTTAIGNCSGSYNLDWWSEDFVESWAGHWNCVSASGGTCPWGVVRINDRVITTLSRYYKTSCHEAGHAASLGHWNDAPFEDTCMMEGGNYTSNAETFNSHDRSEINAQY